MKIRGVEPEIRTERLKRPERTGGAGEQQAGLSAQDSAAMSSISSSIAGSIRKGLDLAGKAISGLMEERKKEASPSSGDNDTFEMGNMSRPDIYQTLKTLKEAGVTFTIQGFDSEEQSLSYASVYKRYGENDRSMTGLIRARKGEQSFPLPCTDEDLQLLSFFLLGGDSKSLKAPAAAEMIKKVHDNGKTFHDRYLAKCFEHRPADQLYTYSHATGLSGKRDAQSDLHFRDGEKYFQIESTNDFLRACVLSGAADPAGLSQDERKALPVIKQMVDEGAVLTEKYGTTKAGPLAALRAVGEGFPSIMYIDDGGRRNEIKCLKDLDRIDRLYRQKDLSGFAGQERDVLESANKLLGKGAVFTDLSLSPKPYGAAMIAKSAFKEDRDALREPVFFKDARGRLAEINRPEDLKRIEALYFDGGISSLPQNEQKTVLSLKRIFDAEKSPAVRYSANMLGFMKGIQGDIYPGEIYLDNSARPLTVTVSTLQDVDRFVAFYMDRDLSSLPADEREAIERLQALEAAGVSFQNRGAEKMDPIRNLQVLKGESKSLDEIWLKTPFGGNNGAVIINNLNDPARLDAMFLKKDLSVLPRDEAKLISEMRELRASGMTFRGYYDESDLTILKGIKGELGKAFVKHKSGTESALDDPDDFARLKALYLTGDLTALPAGEREIVNSINFMRDSGYHCAVVYNGQIKSVEPFDVLKSAKKGYAGVGFVDSNQAFTGISSARDLDDLKAIHCGQNLDSYSPGELKLIKLIQELMSKGYRFEADSSFRDTDSLGNRVTGTRYYPIGALTVLKSLRSGNTDIWLFKSPGRVPISDFLDVVGMADRMEKIQNEEAPFQQENIREEDGFVTIGGVRLPVKGV